MPALYRILPAPGCFPFVVGEVLICTGRYESSVRFMLVAQSCVVQGRLPVAILRVHTGAPPYQFLNEPNMAAVRRKMQSSPPLFIGRVRIRATIECGSGASSIGRGDEPVKDPAWVSRLGLLRWICENAH